MKILLWLPMIVMNLSIKTEDVDIYSMTSFYAENFHGRKTANGEIYDMYDYTCASPNLPFGTILKVTNLDNDKFVIVRVNDRGPFAVHKNGTPIRPLQPHPTRDLDLSLSAFENISKRQKGVIKIKYSILNE